MLTALTFTATVTDLVGLVGIVLALAVLLRLSYVIATRPHRRLDPWRYQRHRQDLRRQELLEGADGDE